MDNVKKALTFVSLTGIGILGFYLFKKKKDKPIEKNKKDISKKEIHKSKEEFISEIKSYIGEIDLTIYWDLDISLIPKDILIYLSFLKKNYKSESVKVSGGYFLSYDQIIELYSKVDKKLDEDCFIAIFKNEKDSSYLAYVYCNPTLSFDSGISIVSISEDKLIYHIKFGVSLDDGKFYEEFINFF